MAVADDIEKLPKPPVPGVEGFEDGHMEPKPALPAVFDRIKLPKPGLPEEESAVGSSASPSLKSLGFLGNQDAWSSRPKRFVAVGEPRPPAPNGFESCVSRRRVPGRVAVVGEVMPKTFPDPCDKEALRPFTLV